MIDLLAKLGLKFISFWLDREEKRKEAKKKFLLFVDELENNQTISVNLNKSDQAQLDELRKMRK